MGHWWESDEFLDSVAARVGNVGRAALRETARAAAQRIELLAGRRFGATETQTAAIHSGGLPFVDVDDLQVGTQSADVDVWPVPDLANPALAQVLQVRALAATVPKAEPDHRALRNAGRFVAEVHRQGRLSRDFVIEKLEPLFQAEFDEQQRLDFLRRLADPTVRIHLPIATSEANGWWFQIARRLIVATSRHSRDARYVVERVFDDLPLVATEPVLIVARMTTHPVERAYAIRIWAMNGEEPSAAWRIIARAVHRYGVPILTVDDASTAEETSCQLLLLAHWHGYVARDEPDLGAAIASAYPRPVQRIKRATGVPDELSAAALLLELLLHPGFDPIRGAHSVRKYVSRMARITVVEHRKANHTGAHAWDLFGVSERRYYKLLRRFAYREAGRWQVDDDVRKRIDSYLRARDKHAAGLDLLRGRGFNEAAARKWLQRHPVEATPQAIPRTYRRRARA